jgi:hypothetical protein
MAERDGKASGQNQTEESAGFPEIPGLTANMAGSKCQILSTRSGHPMTELQMARRPKVEVCAVSTMCAPDEIFG